VKPSLTRVAALAQIIGTCYMLWMGYSNVSSQQTGKATLDFLVAGLLITAGVVCYAQVYRRSAMPRPQNTTAATDLALTTLPDTVVRANDPKLEVRFVDDRWSSASEKDYVHFELINRGQSEAQFACIEPFHLGSHRVNLVKHKIESLISPDHSSKSFYVEIEQADKHLSALDIFDVSYLEWEALKSPQLHELKIPITATYQDAGRNLFETRCDLVFYPGEHVRKLPGVKVLETKNHKWRRVATAIPRIDWAA
jgi:hypothetical protein